MRRDTVKGVLENFHASTPRFSAAFPRGVKTYRGGEKKRRKEKEGENAELAVVM